MSAEVVRLRTRKERSADSLLAAAEGLREAMAGLESMASLAVQDAVSRGITEQHSEALRSAAALVMQAGDLVAVTVMMALDAGVVG